jgi:phosphoadenosine phosphosulfate reductase
MVPSVVSTTIFLMIGVEFMQADGLTESEIDAYNARFEQAPPKDILEWAWETLGPNVAASSSFQTQSVPLLHLISETCPEMPIIFLDTGFHFPETLRFRDDLIDRFGLNVEVMHPEIEKDELFERHGEAPYRTDPDLCCHINKVEPMQRALEGRNAWINGVRKDQTDQREQLDVLEWTSRGILRVHPMLTWTSRDMWTHINEHDLPAHPLFEEGYMSIGCAPCTSPPSEEGGERDGRWSGSSKSECGLHTEMVEDEEVES